MNLPLDSRPYPGNPPMKLHSAKTSTQFLAAICLALIAGYLDAYGFIVLGTFVSFVGGNSVFMGLRIGQGRFYGVLAPAIAILSFVVGSFLANLFTKSKIRDSHRIIFGLVAALVGTVAALEADGLYNRFAEMVLLSVAMGMVNPALNKIGSERVSVTFITGTLSRLGGHLASAARGEPFSDGRGALPSDFLTARTDLSVWLAFLTGAVFTGVMISHSHSRTWPLTSVCVLLLGVALLTPADEGRAAV